MRGNCYTAARFREIGATCTELRYLRLTSESFPDASDKPNAHSSCEFES